MRYVLGLLLLSTTFVWAQPEGPWIIDEVGLNANMQWPVVVADDADTIMVFYTLYTYAGQWLEQREISVSEFVVVDSFHQEIEDTLNYHLTDALVFDSGDWVVSAHATLSPYRSVRQFVRNASGIDVDILAEGSHTFLPYAHGSWVLPPTLAYKATSGFIVSWIRGNDDNWAGEPHQDAILCFVPDIESPAERSPYLINTFDVFLYGPSRMAIESAVGDTAVALLSRSPDYPGWGDPVSGSLYPGSFGEMDGPLIPLPCADQPIDIVETVGHNWLLLADSSAPRIYSFDLAGNCMLREDLGSGPDLAAAAWNDHYGFVLLHVEPSSIRITRTDTSGSLTYPEGVFYWQDTNFDIRQGNVAISDSGWVVVTWTERSQIEDYVRLMLAAMPWDAPLVSNDRFVPHPSSLILSAYPNPFNGELHIQYELMREGAIELAVFNVLGQQVAKLESGIERAGSHQTVWSPTAGSGIYFVSLRTEHGTRTRKVLFAR